MIAIDRGDEPAALAEARARHLPRAWVDRVFRGAEVSSLTLEGYQAEGVLEALLERQGSRCAFCECTLRPEALQREHFRPVRGAWRTDQPERWREGRKKKVKDPVYPGSWDAEGYWWLTWTWENLLLSCGGCNGPLLKDNHFALETGSVRLPVPSMHAAANKAFELDRERALLVDPTVEDPLTLIEWRPAEGQAPWTATSWSPLPLPGPDGHRAQYTIALMGLDKSAASAVTGYIRTIVLALAAPHRGQPVIDDQIMKLRENLFSPTSPHQGATWWALVQLLPALKDRLPRPGRLGPRAAASPWPARPDLAGLPELIQLRVRALGARSQEADDGPALVADILVHRPQATDAELAALLGRKESTIQGWRP